MIGHKIKENKTQSLDDKLKKLLVEIEIEKSQSDLNLNSNISSDKNENSVLSEVQKTDPKQIGYRLTLP